MAKEKKESLDSIINSLIKEDDEFLYNGKEAALKDTRIQFDAPRLTWAYGGSFKLNAIHRFNGKESGGKTTLATYIAGQCQRRKFEKDGNWNNAHVVILDYERSFDVIHAQCLGLILEDPETGKPLVHVSRKKYVEEGEEAWEQMVQTGQVCCTIYDSDAAGACHTELDNEIGKANFGALAKANGINIKRMNIYVDQYTTPVLWISQERANQELMAHLPKPTGGEAVNFFPSTRFRVTPKDPITKNGETVGITIKAKNYKNKTGIPFRECYIDLYFKPVDGHSSGIDAEGQYLDMAKELGLINQRGAWYYYKEDTPDAQKFQGFAGAVEFFKNNPAEFDEIKKAVNSVMAEFNEKLDKNSVEVDEEVEFQKEQMEAKAKREAAIKNLAEEALAASKEESSETNEAE